jgi:hypothetical protein
VNACPLQQQAHVGALGRVVVGAEAHRPNDVLAGVSPGQHENGELLGAALLADMGKQLEAVHVGHVHVENDCVDNVGGDRA